MSVPARTTLRITWPANASREEIERLTDSLALRVAEKLPRCRVKAEVAHARVTVARLVYQPYADRPGPQVDCPVCGQLVPTYTKKGPLNGCLVPHYPIAAEQREDPLYPHSCCRGSGREPAPSARPGKLDGPG